MPRHRSRVYPRNVLIAALGGAVAIGAAPALAAPTAAKPDDRRVEVLRSFAEQALDRGSRGDLRAAEPSAKEATAKEPATSQGAKPDQSTSFSARSGASAVTAAADAGCVDVNAQVTQTLDHNHITWDPVPGATIYTVQRQRLGGSIRTVAPSLPASTTSFTDAAHNPLGSVAYTVTATGDELSVSCRSPQDGWWSMSTDDGVGYPDLFFAGDDSVFEEDTYGPAFPAWSAQASRPAFSPNGRLVASVEAGGDSTVITVRRASTGALQWSVPSPAGVALDEPAFSPDSQRIAVESLDPDGNPMGLYTIAVNTAHTLVPVPSSTGLVTPDWIDTPGAASTTTLVAADLSEPGGLLTLVNPSTGARTALAGTDGGLDPTGLPDGSVLYTTMDGTGAGLARRSAGGSVTPLQTYPQGVARWPVLAPDGSIYVYLEEPDPDDPAAVMWSIQVVDQSGVSLLSTLGMARDGDTGFYGFDLRTAVSPGTSNFGGSANPDVLARNNPTGVLYAYPLSATAPFFDARRSIGSGWNVMKQFIAAGDLNGDRRADVLAIDDAGVLWSYPGRGGFRFNTRTRVGGGWGSYAIISTGDVNGDTRADLIARDPAGVLWLYPGNGRGGLATRTQIGTGWQVFNAIVGPGDWDYDGRPDLLARDRATGVLYLYPGNGTGGFGTRRSLGKGWNARTGFAASETWLGLNSLFARTTDGTLLDYDSVGDGVVNSNHVYPVSGGWNPYSITG